MSATIEVTFRLADPKTDREPLGKLLAAMVRHYLPERPAEETATGDRVVAVLSSHPGCEVLIAERAGRPLGFATFTTSFPADGVEPELFMRDLFVMPEERAAGLGEAMMRYLARLALDRGCARVEWMTDAANSRAVALYDRIGGRRLEGRLCYRLDREGLAAIASGRS